MKTFGTRSMQQARRRHLILPNGAGYFRSEFMPEDAQSAAPQAFLVEQDPHSTVLPHYHRQNQFQIIVSGGGTLGRHEVQALVVHYAGAYTGYGPICAGAQGIGYLTLRPHYDQGAQFMPEARASMVRGPKKHFSSEQIHLLGAQGLRVLARPLRETLLAPDDDGLAALLYRLPPGAHTEGNMRLLDPATGAGQFAVVAGGSILHEGRVLEPFESIFLSSDETALSLTAGADGAEVLLLQYPPLAAAYRAPVETMTVRERTPAPAQEAHG